MPEPKARPLNESGGTTAASPQTPELAEEESPTGPRSSDRDSNPRRTVEEDESAPGGKQTVESSRREASLGQRPTRDDGANDDKGELK